MAAKENERKEPRAVKAKEAKMPPKAFAKFEGSKADKFSKGGAVKKRKC